MKRLISLLLIVLMLATACSTAVPAPTPPTPTPIPTPAPTPPEVEVPEPGSMEQRLELLVDKLEEQRQTLHVPGMALAVVKDDELILAHGFGVSNVEKGTPVTAETLFPIGSSTKAFTSTTIGMLVDEGKIDWDDPVTDYLPYFTMDIDSDDANDQITIRDILCHRTGFPRMGLLFASGAVPREEILQAATAAEPWAAFRDKFYYNNVMYMAAGTAAASAAGSSWDEMITERIFEPLGMESSSTSLDQVQDDNRLSLGYLWEESLNDYRYKPMRNLDNIGPAGSINSNVLDMSQWLRFQLGGGQYEGTRLITEEQLQETRTPQIQISSDISYGLGWMLREWEGQPVVEHGGNTDGFSAEVAMLPDSNLGFVLLTNASASPLQQTSLNIVWETLLGEWEDAGTPGEATAYEAYTGEYIANFAAFENVDFTVLVQNNRLAVDVPGQMIYELKAPDEEGKWYFTLTDEIAVSFDEDGEGTIFGMKMYQAGMTFELPRKGIEQEAEIPLEELEKYIGHYRSEELEVTTGVLIQNKRLAIDWPGEMIYELYPPDENGIRVFRISDRFSLMFNEDQNGKVESLTYYQDGREYELLRVESETLPSLDEILALREMDKRRAALEKMEIYSLSGTINSLQSGVKGTLITYIGGTDRYRIESDYGKFGKGSSILNGDQSWEEFSGMPPSELYGDLLEQAKMGHPESFYGDWVDFFDSIQPIRSAELDGNKVYVLQLRRGELPPVTIYVDAKNGDVLKAELLILTEGGIAIPVETLYQDYRKVKGVRIPFRTISSNEASGRTVMQIEEIETILKLHDDFFSVDTYLEG
jgi:CubicO group peptidase (beta-lactamase class C family)